MGRRLLGRVGFAVSVAVTLSMSGYVPAAVAKPGGASAAAHDRSVAVSAFKASASAVKHPPAFVPGKAKWPSAGSAVMDLAVQPGGGRRGSASVGGLPVTVSSVVGSSQRAGVGRADAAESAAAPAQVRVDVLDRASSARAHTPLALRVSRTDGLSGGAVRVSVDYSAFRDAFGGDWSNRVGLAVVADCAVTATQCASSPTPLASTVDSQASVVSADVDLAAVPLEDPAPGLVSPSPTDDMTDPAAVGPVDPYLGSFPVASGPAAAADGADLPPPSSPSAAAGACLILCV